MPLACPLSRAGSEGHSENQERCRALSHQRAYTDGPFPGSQAPTSHLPPTRPELALVVPLDEVEKPFRISLCLTVAAPT
jgi:hypothetical protein